MMTTKKIVKTGAAILVLIGYTVGHYIISSKMGEIIGEKLVDWVES